MLTSIELIFGAILLLLGGETLVRGAAQIAIRFGLSRLMVGMVIAGFGTSMPEMVVSVRAVLGGTPNFWPSRRFKDVCPSSLSCAR